MPADTYEKSSATASVRLSDAEPALSRSPSGSETQDFLAIDKENIAGTPNAAFNYDAPPDGGREAWMVVLGSTLALFSTFGVVNSYVRTVVINYADFSDEF